MRGEAAPGLPGDILSMEGLGRVRFISALEPVVDDAPTVAWQVLERIQAVEVIDRYLCDGLWLRQAQIDRNAATTLRVNLFPSPKCHAATG